MGRRYKHLSVRTFKNIIFIKSGNFFKEWISTLAQELNIAAILPMQPHVLGKPGGCADPYRPAVCFRSGTPPGICLQRETYPAATVQESCGSFGMRYKSFNMGKKCVCICLQTCSFSRPVTHLKIYIMVQIAIPGRSGIFIPFALQVCRLFTVGTCRTKQITPVVKVKQGQSGVTRTCASCCNSPISGNVGYRQRNVELKAAEVTLVLPAVQCRQLIPACIRYIQLSALSVESAPPHCHTHINRYYNFAGVAYKKAIPVYRNRSVAPDCSLDAKTQTAFKATVHQNACGSRIKAKPAVRIKDSIKPDRRIKTLLRHENSCKNAIFGQVSYSLSLYPASIHKIKAYRRLCGVQIKFAAVVRKSRCSNFNIKIPCRRVGVYSSRFTAAATRSAPGIVSQPSGNPPMLFQQQFSHFFEVLDA